VNIEELGLSDERLEWLRAHLSAVDMFARIDTVFRALALRLGHADLLYIAHGIYRAVAAMELDEGVHPYFEFIRGKAMAVHAAVPAVKQPSEERLVADAVSFMRNALGGVDLDTPLRLGVAEKILQCLAGEIVPSDDETLATVLAASPSDIKATATAMLNAATKQFADEAAK
jgi:hypothetical protein